MVQVTKSEWRRRHAEAMARLAPAPQGWLGLPVDDTRRERVTMRLPCWVLDHFRDQGPGYQLKIETVLAAWVAGRRGDVQPVPRDLDPEVRAEVLAKVRAEMAEEKRAAEELALAEMGERFGRTRARMEQALAERDAREELERWGPEGRPGDE